jgi:CBS domain-containing protein
VVLRRLPLETPVREISHFDIVTVDADDFIFDALILMTRHNKRRVAIKAGGDFVGILEDIDILGLFAGNSQLIPGRIDRARSVADLEAPARDIESQVERLHRQGIKIEVIAEITSGLNRNLFAKLFDFSAPASIREAGTLLVMGSEGRGEQTVRTDQDNALLLAGEVPDDDIDAFRERFSGALAGFGFPPCPGNVMVRNPLWSQPIDSFIRQLKTWAITPSEANTMNLGIFFDAIAVAGRPDLLDRAKKALIDLMKGESVYLAHFAHLIDRFEGVNPGMLNSLMLSVGVGAKLIDIKKSGTFPIVHGMRALAIDQGILATSTAARIEQVVGRGLFGDKFGRELAGALRVFMEMRLRSQLRAVRLAAAGEEDVVRLNELSTTDRDLLRDALRLVKQFRELVSHRYNLRAF